MSRDKRKIDTSDRPRNEAVDDGASDAAAPPADDTRLRAKGQSGPGSSASGGPSGASGPNSDHAGGSSAESGAQMGQPGTPVADSAGGQPGAAGSGKKVEVIDLAAAKDGDSSATGDITGEPTESDGAGVDTATRPAKGTSSTTAGPLGAELEALRGELDERVRDLQRVTAEYANYRKRVERDRGVMAEQAVAMVLASLLPILDDLDRARDHGDLVGPFGAVAEQLTTALAKFGLTGFGEQGDVFDPTRHEAVAHQTSAEVTEPTCVAVMRRGYMLGDRQLRAALVAVADPE